MGTPRSSCSARRKVASGVLRLNKSFYPGWHRGDRRSKGFTLVELLVVIAIIGILAPASIGARKTIPRMDELRAGRPGHDEARPVTGSDSEPGSDHISIPLTLE